MLRKVLAEPGGAARQTPPLRVVRACARLDEARNAWAEVTRFAAGVDENILEPAEPRIRGVVDGKVQGFGKDFATATNDTPEGRAQNRRTEIVLPD